MSELATVSRVTIYAGKALEHTLLGQVVALGAKGYTSIDCKGVGDHGSVSDPFMSSTQVRVEVIAQLAVAQKILQYVSLLRGQSVIAVLEDVQVTNSARF